jgi:hypothetical protein
LAGTVIVPVNCDDVPPLPPFAVSRPPPPPVAPYIITVTVEPGTTVIEPEVLVQLSVFEVTVIVLVLYPIAETTPAVPVLAHADI